MHRLTRHICSSIHHHSAQKCHRRNPLTEGIIVLRPKAVLLLRGYDIIFRRKKQHLFATIIYYRSNAFNVPRVQKRPTRLRVGLQDEHVRARLSLSSGQGREACSHSSIRRSLSGFATQVLLQPAHMTARIFRLTEKSYHRSPFCSILFCSPFFYLL